ncbi:hypothetical protein CYLTODRAFT_106599 [Cylindrobasidium torrendii FP15055 ss-10]|uniref:Uncharacterized protein n=1 Tax=Cylindrobasidium torrendii FP15055 ss-10 TaxID=1314674 RepID=A0A0D7B1G0_9AGAR|nr:hypothetical protein CYLTODRAFT_106599 [Cylindrobasidium torrendii FP15055 ss-10]
MIPRLEAIRHPIRYIPDDVLGLILTYATPWCLEDDLNPVDSFPPPGGVGEYVPPWTLSHVCRNWRAVCLSLPHLWSALSTDTVGANNPLCAEMIDTICRRSEPLPLRLDIGRFPPTSGLINTAHRWRRVRVTFSCPQADIFKDRVFPCLTQLVLHLNSDTICENIVAPRLYNLELRGGGINPRLRLPWEQITQYRSFNTSLEFLKDMKNLEEFSIGEGASAPTGLHPPGSIILPKMRRFEYEASHHHRVRGGFYTLIKMFNQRSLMSLRTLIVDEPYVDLVERPPLAFTLPSLIELSMNFGRADSVRDILSAAPNVQSLHINCWEDPKSLGYCSTPGHPFVASLRQLKHLSLTLEECFDPKIDFATLDEAVAAFKTYGLPLETMSFYSGPTWGWKARWIAYVFEGMADSLDMCRKNGIRVQYHHDTEHKFV